jgi:hypothetical protein
MKNRLILLGGIIILILIIYFNRSFQISNKSYEMFEDKKKTASESVSDALQNIIKAANKVGKRMLNPELWNERLGMLNKSPMDLARMHIVKHS